MNAVYLLDISCFEDELLFKKYCSEISSERLNLINKLKCPSDKKLSLGISVLLGIGLKAYGIREKNIVYSYESNGKPFFRDYPDIYFNPSHSGKYSLCVFSDSKVGADIEKKRCVNSSILNRYFTDEESSYVMSGKSSNDKNIRFVRLWTLKESYLKYTSGSISKELKNIKLCFDKNNIYIKNVSFKEYQKEGYSVSICSEKNKFTQEKIKTIKLV